MQIYLPCGATRNYYFFGSTEHLPELVRVHKEHHLSFSVVQCAVPAFLAPLLAKGEEGHQSETLTFLLHSHSLPENREQCGDLEKKNVIVSIPSATLLSPVLSAVIWVCLCLRGELSHLATAQHGIPEEFNFENPLLTERIWCCVIMWPIHMKGLSFLDPFFCFTAQWM